MTGKKSEKSCLKFILELDRVCLLEIIHYKIEDFMNLERNIREVHLFNIEKNLINFSEPSRATLYKALCSILLGKLVHVSIRATNGVNYGGKLVNVENDCVAISRFEGHVQLCPLLKIINFEVVNEIT